MPAPIPLTLAHSPDPDDVFMWWPLTGKIRPDGTMLEPPRLDTGRFTFRALPADIHLLNRRAIERGDLDVTALSARAYCDVKDRYAITSCGGSFGDGYGPKLVARKDVTPDEIAVNCINCVKAADVRVAVPGRQTTAFLLLCLAMGLPREKIAQQQARFVEMPFERIIGAVARREVEAGLVIHEGQVTFGDAGLRMVLDVGAWWKQRTGLLTPLGVNAVRRGLDAEHGVGTVKEVSRLLRESVRYAMDRREESTAYALPFALANVDRAGAATGETPTLERVDRYCRMYVTEQTLDMGESGREAIVRLLREGASLGLCPDPGSLDLV